MENAPANFNAIKPTKTAYQSVKILMKRVKVIAVERERPWILRRLINVPSDTPIPPGRNDATPRIIDDV